MKQHIKFIQHGMWRLCRGMAPLALLGLAPGCATLNGNYEEEAMAQREDVAILQEDYRRVAGSLEGVQLELDRLRAEVERLRNSQPQGVEAQVQNLQSSLNDLDRRLRAAESARERDKQEILDRLSSKITQVMSASAAAAKPKPVAKKPISNEGYEHVVEAGQSLSAIASAYGVKASDIIEANGLTNANQLRVGQKLFIPAKK